MSPKLNPDEYDRLMKQTGPPEAHVARPNPAPEDKVARIAQLTVELNACRREREKMRECHKREIESVLYLKNLLERKVARLQDEIYTVTTPRKKLWDRICDWFVGW